MAKLNAGVFSLPVCVSALSLLLAACGQGVPAGSGGAGVPGATAAVTTAVSSAPGEPVDNAPPTSEPLSQTSAPEELPSIHAEVATAMPEVSPGAVIKDNQVPRVRPPQSGDLLTRARQDGSVRIIVGLDVPFVPEGDLPDAAAVDAQYKAINDAQTALVDRLSDFKVSDVTLYESIPFVAMAVDAAALEALMHDPAVTSIEEDGIAGPAARPN